MNYPKKNKKKILWILLILFLIIAVIGLDSRMTTKTYYLQSHKISSNIKIGFVADLHSCDYGEGQRELFEAIDKTKPDIILLGGDIVDDRLPKERAFEFLRGIQQRYPVYYVTGNHEYWTEDVEQIKQMISEIGIEVLDGRGELLNLKGQLLYLAGIDDPEVGEEIWQKQLQTVAESEDKQYFSILLTHRPERYEQYIRYGFDLALAGHAHGGQWRLPLLINGVYAPNQGIFPKYAGGLYHQDQTRMIVSRGLARESTRIPRIFNRPEYVVVQIAPQ